VPLTTLQITTLAAQDANVPGFAAVQALQKLNLILSDLAQDYDIAPARKTLRFNLPTAVNAEGQATMALPADYLRARKGECIYYNNFVPYPLIPCDLEEIDALVTTPGNANFPVYFTTDMSTSPPTAFFWQQPSAALPALIRYQSQMPDITDTSTVPWFPNQNYLLTRLTGELCKGIDDERANSLLTDREEVNVGGAGVILRLFLTQHGDKSNRAQTVTLDRRRFGTSFDRLRNTKQVGW
jgi:hypothetical protein